MTSPNGQERGRRSPGSDETRLRLLRAAAELIAEVGWGAVTTRAVAARAQLPHGAVSYHFRGKQELLTEAALHVFDQAFPLSELEAMGDLSDLMAMFEPWLESEPTDALVTKVGIEAMLESERNPVLRERMLLMLREFRGAVSQLVRAAQERGTAPAEISSDALAALLGAAADGVFLHARLDPEFDARGTLDALRTLLGR